MKLNGVLVLCTILLHTNECIDAFSIPRNRNPLQTSYSFLSRHTLYSTTSSTETNNSNNNENIEFASTKWSPKIQSIEERRKLRGNLHNTEIIGTKGFHHVEFYCGDAKSTAYRFSLALGMPITCVSNQSTGNDVCCSYGLTSGDIRFLFTAPYSLSKASKNDEDNANDSDVIYDAPNSLPSFENEKAHAFFQKHGLAAKAIGVKVLDAAESYEAAVKNGAKGVSEPTVISSCHAISKEFNDVDVDALGCKMAEVELYGDVVLRFVSFDHSASDSLSSMLNSSRFPILPNYAPSPTLNNAYQQPNYGLQRIDHAVGNVPDLLETLQQISTFTGFHEFAEFTSEDVGTIDSGLNSVVLASDSENVLLPINEPTEGKRKSQIQTYLEQNEGPGLQHLALKTGDIFFTIEEMRKAEMMLGGFELMARPSDGYYRDLPDRLGDQLTPEQYEKIEDLGILADADDEGILLQIFTKPIGDRPTFFIEIIQRIGCLIEPDSLIENESELNNTPFEERPGCGGFGQGNFKELFKSIEDHEKTLKI